MSRFLTHTLPVALVEAQNNREALEREKWDIGRKLDDNERWGDHNCDCEYCEVQDYKQLSFKEIEELEKQFEDLDQKIKDHDTEIKRMIAYKEFMEKRQ